MMTRWMLIASLSMLVIAPASGLASELPSSPISGTAVEGGCGPLFFAEPQMMSSTQSLSCADECYQASLTCTSQCGGTEAECQQSTQICYDSCWRGVGPWLPC